MTRHQNGHFSRRRSQVVGRRILTSGDNTGGGGGALHRRVGEGGSGFLDLFAATFITAERLDVVGALHLRSVHGLRYSNGNIARHNCDDLSLNTP